MRLGFRAKFFVAGVTLVAVANLASGLYLDVQLSGWLRKRIEDDLLAHAGSAAELLRRLPPNTPVAEIDGIADRLAKATRARVTIIASDGRVLGDSKVAAAALAKLTNHLQRPEIRMARVAQKGVARRYSETLSTEMVYVALRYRADGSVVRVATPLAKEQEVLAGMRWLLLMTGLLTLAAVVLLAAFGSRAFSRTLRELVDNSRAILAGQARRIQVHSRDEIAHLAGSFNILAEELESNVNQLASERATMEAVLEGMSESVLALDAEQRITLANDAAAKLLGLEEPPLGRRLEEVIPIPGLSELVEQAEGEQLSKEFKSRQPVKRWLQVTAAPLNEDGRVVVLHDMTTMRKLEGMRRNFVANVSHELRTPVSIIRANTETLLDGAMEEPKAARTFLEAVLRHTERLARIISDLLDISRVEAGRYHFELETLEVSKMAERAVELMSESAERKQVTVKVEVDEGVEVHADSGALEQVLFNLLENAIKYTPEGGTVRIRARPHRLPGYSEVEVIDDGGGIPQKHRSRLFERFYRVDRGRSRDMGGTGLGLAIVKHLCEALGGQVGMRPAEPHGSNFWVSLPSEPLPELPDQDES